MILNDVKTLLGLNDITDAVIMAEIDDKLNIIQTMTESHYKTYTGAVSIPQEHNFIISEIMIRRYNRIGSEGFTEHQKEGLSITFEKSDFDEYLTILKKAYPDTFSGYGGIKFL